MEDNVYYDKDIFVNTILFAIDKAIEAIKDSKSNHDALLVGMLIRSRVAWHNANIRGIDAIGMTYDQFVDQISNKRNIFFLSDDELERCYKGIEIMDILNR